MPEPARVKIGQRYGNNRTEILNEDGTRCVATVWTHDRKRIDAPARDVDDYGESADGMATLRRLVASYNATSGRDVDKLTPGSLQALIAAASAAFEFCDGMADGAPDSPPHCHEAGRRAEQLQLALARFGAAEAPLVYCR